MQRQWLSKEVAARRAKANGCQRKSQRDVLSITRRSHLTITTLQQQHLLAFPWIDGIADYNIDYVRVKEKKKKVTFIIVNNYNNNNNTVMAKITRKMLINYIVARDVGVVGAE